MGMILAFIGLAIGILAFIGLIRGKAPLLQLKGRPAYAGLLVGGLLVMAVGGTLLPKSEVVLTFTPANAVVKVDGQAYSTSPVKLKLTDLSYTVEASADGYKPQKVKWDTSKQKSLNVALVKKTPAELAQEKAAADKARADAAAAQKAAEEASKPAAPTPEEAGMDKGLFEVKCEDAVRNLLKSPSSAKFPSAYEAINAIQSGGGGKKQWIGWVDSQNSFGAVIRTEFICTHAPPSEDVEAALYE